MVRSKLEVSYGIATQTFCIFSRRTLSAFLGLNFAPFAIDVLSDFIYLGNL